MNIRDFEYLLAVAELKHFGKAAERCNVSQPTLSMQLKKLEEYLGVQLFERDNKSVIITKIGSEIAEKAKQILLATGEIKSMAKNAQNPFSGEFILGAFPTLAPYFLPVIVPKVTEKLPDIKLLLLEEKTDILLGKLRKAEIDAALLATPIEGDDLECAELFSDDFLLAVYDGHPLSRKKSVKPSDLLNEKLLLLEEGHCLRSQALEFCSLIGAGERQDFRATSLETLRQMVRSKVGITLIPSIAKREGDGIIYIPIVPKISRKIALVWRKTSSRKPLLQAIFEILKNNS